MDIRQIKSTIYQILQKKYEPIFLKEFLQESQNIKLDLCNIFFLHSFGIIDINFQKETFEYKGKNGTIQFFTKFAQDQINFLKDEKRLNILRNQNQIIDNEYYQRYIIQENIELGNIEKKVLTISNQEHPLQIYLAFADFLQKIICSLLIDSNKLIQKEFLIELVNKYEKKFLDRSIFLLAVDFLKIFGFIIVSASSPIVTWQGPEMINFMGFYTEDLMEISQQETNIQNLIKEFLSTQENEILNRENIYWRMFFKDFLNEEQIVELLKSLCDKDKSVLDEGLNHTQLDPKRFGYAVLQGENCSYYIRKLRTIIGWKNRGKNQKVRWLVDMDIKDNKKISKQHALIIYNFQSQCFDIKCLSLKYPIRINDKEISLRDKAIGLQNQSLISIGDQVYYFLLAKN